MIDNREQLYVTKEIYNILVKYAKLTLIPKLLREFSFHKDGSITNLLETINHYNCEALPPEEKFEMISLIANFINNHKEDDKMSLYFWSINEDYIRYYEEFEMQYETDDETENDIDRKFGRFLAYKIYDPNGSGLESDLNDNLYDKLLCFASEHDLSAIDENTIEYVNEVILKYSRI